LATQWWAGILPNPTASLRLTPSGEVAVAVIAKSHRVAPEAARKVVLAFSGGLDSTVLVSVLRENYGYEVITTYVHVGEGSTDAAEIESLRRQAMQAGACEFHFLDARERFVEKILVPSMQANALYQGRYPLASALSRIVIMEGVVELAKRRGAMAIAHGASGKGNDQVRFDLCARALDPSLRIIAPQRERYMSRNAALEYAAARNIRIPSRSRGPYSIDTNLWGRSVQGGDLEFIDRAPPDSVWEITVDPVKAPDTPQEVVIRFESGVPVAVDGEAMSLVPLIGRVNALAASHGVGRIDLLEDRVSGIKSREIYEAPGAIALIEAHRDLEATVIDRHLRAFKQNVDHTFSGLVYDGLWHSPLRDALQAFGETVQPYVTGEVRLRFFKGHLTVIGRSSPFALYDKGLATYGIGDRFNHRAAEGWTHLEALPLGMFRTMHPMARPEPLPQLFDSTQIAKSESE
jgi:argininosuccinate synthase